MGYFSPTVQFFGHLGEKILDFLSHELFGSYCIPDNNCKILELASIDSFVTLM
jgi:hypothetical protein